MTPNDYQAAAARTINYLEDVELTRGEIFLLGHTLAALSEMGEFGDEVKKIVFHRHPMDLNKLTLELGDVCWYIASLCTLLGISLEDVMRANIDKLMIAYPRGFTPEGSRKRHGITDS